MRVIVKSLAKQATRSTVGLTLLILALVAGTATAGRLITGDQIQNHSITGRDIRKHSLTAAVFERSIAGPKGATGVRGSTGPTGPTGPTGAAGPAAITNRVRIVAPQPSGTASEPNFLVIPGLGRLNFDCGHNSQNPPEDYLQFVNTSADRVDLFINFQSDPAVYQEILPTGTQGISAGTIVAAQQTNTNPKVASITLGSKSDGQGCTAAATAVTK